MGMKEDLAAIVGVENVSADAEELKLYSKDYSVSMPSMPNYVARPKNVEEIQNIVKLANRTQIPLIPCSSSIHFNGAALPVQGGIMVDLRKMNRILNIDIRNRAIRIEPGVTWTQLQDELDRHDLMALNPLFAHPLKSALSGSLEREPMLIPKFEYGDPILNLEVVLPNGDLMRSGSSCTVGFPDNAADGVNPQGPGIDWVKLFQGAQGTMGIVTWMIVKAEVKPKVNKTFFMPFERIDQAIEPIYRIQKNMIGSECLLLNRVNLAAILAEKWPGDFSFLREILPPWTLILILAGGWRRPEERIEYEEEALNRITMELGIPEAHTSLKGAPGLEKKLPGMLRNAWPSEKVYWKFGYKGSCQDIYFHTVLSKAPDFTEIVTEPVAANGYPLDEIGIYIQPLERGRACHFECNFYYNPQDTKTANRIHNLYVEAAETLINNGAFFTRPYGPVANMVYDKAASYTAALKKTKHWLDPNNVMAPGRLCF